MRQIPTMTSELLLAGVQSTGEERRTLDDHDEDVLASVLSGLAAYTADPASAALVHMRHGEVISAWDRAGALRLAQALPPAYGELAEAIVGRYEREE